jgi:hypothetical protein
LNVVAVDDELLEGVELIAVVGDGCECNVHLCLCLCFYLFLTWKAAPSTRTS